MHTTDILLIGVDGGASQVKVHAVRYDPLNAGDSFELRPERAARNYERLDDFEPVAIETQLAERETGLLHRSERECTQAQLWIAACVEAVAEVVAACRGDRVLLGVGMPGIKSADGRGIWAINHGPRIPDYLDRLENGLTDRGIHLEEPVALLGSDADYCGLGEQYAAEGLFADVDSAYYLGGGTGLADAMKLCGQLVPFDRARHWIQKSWQMQSTLGPTFEALLSAKSINARYQASRPAVTRGAGRAVYPEEAAVRGDPSARACLNTAATALAELIFERLNTIKNGRANVSHFGEDYPGLMGDHPFRGTLLDRVVIGQQLGRIYGEPACRLLFAEPVERYLATWIAKTNDRELKDRWLCGDRLRAGLVRASRLRAAPALGAAVAAVRARANRTPR